MVIVQDRLFVFANDVSLVVFLDSMPCLWLSSFRVVNGNDLLRRTRLATGINTRSLYQAKDSAGGSARSAGDQTHDLPFSLRGSKRNDLLEYFRRPIEFYLQLHQLTFHVPNRRSCQSHLHWSHLSGITLAIAHQSQIETAYFLAGNDRRFTRRQSLLYCFTACVPKAWLLAAAAGFHRSVVGPDAE